MFSTNIAQKPASVQSNNTAKSQDKSSKCDRIQADEIKVYEYALTLVDRTNQDRQELTAAFTGLPTKQDWQSWLSGWFDCDYALNSEPTLVRII